MTPEQIKAENDRMHEEVHKYMVQRDEVIKFANIIIDESEPLCSFSSQERYHAAIASIQNIERQASFNL
jgi:hypothetical protein